MSGQEIFLILLDKPHAPIIVSGMNKGKRTVFILARLTVLLLATCGLTTHEQERAILDYYTETNREKYADFLVDIDRYTTSGAEYHKKYFKHIIGVAGDIIEKRKFALEKGSVGFYFDKRSGDRAKLYLGLDINTNSSPNQPFETIAAGFIRVNLKDIMQTLNSCRSIFEEKDIYGMVIGWTWLSSGRTEHLSLWIPKEDVLRFEDNKITFDELVHRSTATNTVGRVVRLPL
jgi:hypothetical protein